MLNVLLITLDLKQRAIRQMLEKLGLNVTAIRAPLREASQQTIGKKFAMIFAEMDIGDEVEDGDLQMVMNGPWRQTPVVWLTEMPALNEEVLARKYGIVAVIKKPFTKEDFKGAIERLGTL